MSIERAKMIKNLSYTSKVLLAYILSCLVLIALSCFSFLFNEWITPLCVLVCSICGSLNSYLLIKGSSYISANSKQGMFILFTFIRYLMMLIGLISSALIVYFTMGKTVNDLRYLIVAVAALPYLCTSLSLAVFKDEIGQEGKK